MKHYDERQTEVKYRSGMQAFLLGFVLCFLALIAMMFGYAFEDISDLCNTLFLMILVYYFLRCLQNDALYQIGYERRFRRQRIMGYIFVALGVLVVALVLIKGELTIGQKVISSGTLLFVVGWMTILQGVCVLRKASLESKEVE